MSGRLGVADLAATTNTGVFTATATTTCNVNLVNRTGAAIAVRVAVVDGLATAIADEDYIEYGVSIPSNGVLERTGVVLTTSETVVAYAAATGVTVRVHGWEEVS